MLPAGTVIAGYRIEQVLGTGGMGAVYLAQNPALPRRDALKVLSAELSRNQEFRTRFVREADVAARLDHPNIVSVYRRGETDDGRLWIAMTYVEGTDADQALRAGTMTPARAVHIVGEIAKALDYAHQRNVVHRDIKPANFLLSRKEGSDERALLADFGIARALDDVGLTATNSVMATVTYAAPEVLAGVRFDHRADLYSLGCTLFRLLTGKTPFSGDAGVPAVMLAHLQQPPPRVTDRLPGLPPALDDVIARAMAKDPAHRFGTAGQLAAAARAALHGPATSITAPWRAIPGAEVSSYPSPGMTPWWQPGSDPRTQIAPGGPPSPARPFPALHRPMTRRPRRRRRMIAVASAVTLLAAAGVTAAVMTRQGSHAPSPPPSVAVRPVPRSALPGLLLSAHEIEAVMGGTVDPGPVENGMAGDSDLMAPKDCAEPGWPRQLIAYQGTGWQAAAGQGLKEPIDPLHLGRVVTEVVVSYPTADLAADFVSNQKTLWTRCSNTQFTMMIPGTSSALYGLGSYHTDSNGILAITSTPQGAEGWACGRALTVRNNVVVDVSACSHDNQEADAIAVAKQIAAKVGLVE
jgi:eukaryotic-like serine/threonine-protein kinase